MNSQTIPVTFLNKDGFRLFGILHQPDSPGDSEVAIILLSPGVKTRVAPHRLYNKMAERFVALGYSVLRFDFYGLGDSEGEVRETDLADLYGAIQVGRYVNDTIAAMDWMQENYGTARFILSGLCGGAITGLLTGARDPRVTSLLGLGIPVILDGSNIDFTRYMTDAQLKGTRKGYLRKFNLANSRAWRSWLRFVTFRSHYSLIARSMMKPILARLRRAEPVAGDPQEPQDNTNPYFAPAFFQMVSTSRRVDLIFSGADRLYWEFEAKFFRRHDVNLQRYVGWYEVHVTPNANHIFSFREWQEDMLEQCCQWLRRNQSATAGVAHSEAGARP